MGQFRLVYLSAIIVIIDSVSILGIFFLGQPKRIPKTLFEKGGRLVGEKHVELAALVALGEFCVPSHPPLLAPTP